VQIYGWGEYEGKPFFALEFCPAGSLDKRLAGTPIPPKEAARLVEALARGMQAAHEAKVIHRDLKPANVLLVEDASAPAPAGAEAPLAGLIPKVTDFGLAKKMDEAGCTHPEAILGTPSYMAPEQAAEGKKEVGPAADIYALGAILYECLTGRPPFRAATLIETLVQVQTEEPVPVRRVQPRVPADLETICHKCLQKEPGKRYASAGHLADDLGRFLRGEPIMARPVRAGERAWRWCRRNPLPAAAGGLAALALLAVLVLSVAFALRERRHSNDLRMALRSARYQVAENHLDRALVPSAQTEPDERLLWLAKSLQEAPADAADLRRVICLNLSAWRRALHELRAPLPHPAVVRCLVFSPDNRLLLTGCADGSTQLWDTRTGQSAGKTLWHGAVVLAVAFDARGRALAAVPGEEDVRVVDARSGKTVAGPFGHEEKVVAAAWSGDGNLLITGSPDNTARVWDLATNVVRGGPLAHDTPVIAVALSADGKRALTGTFGGKAQVWQVGTGQPLGSVLEHPEQVSAVAFAPGGEAILTGCGDNNVRRWDAKTGKHLADPLRHHPGAGTVWGLAPSPDGERLVTAGDDGTARVGTGLWRTGRAVAGPQGRGPRRRLQPRRQAARHRRLRPGGPGLAGRAAGLRWPPGARRRDTARRHQPGREVRRDGRSRWLRPALGRSHRPAGWAGVAPRGRCLQRHLQP
jgi:hypothetical protein